MMHGAHIGGQRAGAFFKLVADLGPRRVLLVGIDVAKATWFVVVSDLTGAVVADGVRLVAGRAGLAELERVIAELRWQLAAAPTAPGSGASCSWNGSSGPRPMAGAGAVTSTAGRPQPPAIASPAYPGASGL